MEGISYFERTLFYDRSSAADEFYERCADLIFEKDPSRTRIEARVQTIDSATVCGEKAQHEKAAHSKNNAHRLGEEQSSVDVYSRPIPDSRSPFFTLGRQEAPGSNTTESKSYHDDISDQEDGCSIYSRASSTCLPTAVDQRQADSGPPLYPGPPRLDYVVVRPNEIESFTAKTKNDFRLFYLKQRNSYSRLQVTKADFERLLRACHVFPRFNEYIIGFGSKISESEVCPPPLKFRPLYTSRGQVYRGFECAYILRYAERTNRPGKFPWSLRHFAIYHRFKPAQRNRCSTWIIVGASERTKIQTDQYTRSVKDLMASNPFELHGIFLDTVTTSWRPYISYLSGLASEQSMKASGVSISPQNSEENIVAITVEDHQQLKQIEDNVADLILCLDATSDTLTTFTEMSIQYFEHQEAIGEEDSDESAASDASDSVSWALQEKAREIVYTRRIAESLLSKIQNTRSLISSLLERQSGHNIEEENKIMKEIAEKNSRDSSSMRVLTIITMVYLPCTIVSNFYSTQFVKQIDLEDGATRLGYAQNVWLFFAISLPLTVLTFLVWYAWIHAQDTRRMLAKWLSPDRKAEPTEKAELPR